MGNAHRPFNCFFLQVPWSVSTEIGFLSLDAQVALRTYPKTPFLENAVLSAPHFPKLNWDFWTGFKGLSKKSDFLESCTSSLALFAHPHQAIADLIQLLSRTDRRSRLGRICVGPEGQICTGAGRRRQPLLFYRNGHRTPGTGTDPPLIRQQLLNRLVRSLQVAIP